MIVYVDITLHTDSEDVLLIVDKAKLEVPTDITIREIVDNYSEGVADTIEPQKSWKLTYSVFIQHCSELFKIL